MQLHPYDPAVDHQVNQLLDSFEANPLIYFEVLDKLRTLLPGSDYFDIRSLAPGTVDRLDLFLD